MKLKPLKPSLREKKRYLVFEVLSQNKVSQDFFEQLVDEVNETLGLFDAANAGVMFIKDQRNRGMLKVNHKYIDKVRVALMLSSLEPDYIIRTLGVSGILRKAEKRYMAG